MATEFYLISDLHFGGDGQLQICDFAAEFIGFLQDLADKSADKNSETELIIVGDTFGFWELTSIEGPPQLDEIIKHHQAIFDQFKLTGSKIKITMMVGNHDYDLACDPVYLEKLLHYNIELEPALSLVREIAGRKIWIEHGQQIDPFNAAPDYGNPFALPAGFFITKNFVAGASRYSVFGTSSWLKDVRSIDIRKLPDWLVSNYFYNEMNLFLRWLLLPFLLLLSITIFALAAQVLKLIGIFDANVLLDNPLIRSLGLFGDIIRWILTISMIVWFFVLTIAVPLYFVYRDILRTLSRFQIYPEFKSATTNEANNRYLNHARQIFAANPEVCAYIFGHTHDAFLVQEAGERAIINTGTWLKILRPVRVRFGWLPAVYYPTFRLNYFRIYEEGERVVINYVEIPKEPEEKLTLLQRFFIFGRKPDAGKPIPSQTILSVDSDLCVEKTANHDSSVF